MKKVPTAQNYSTLITDLASLIEQGRKAAAVCEHCSGCYLLADCKADYRV